MGKNLKRNIQMSCPRYGRRVTSIEWNGSCQSDVFNITRYKGIFRLDAQLQFDGYNFAGFKSAFTPSASTRCARIADIPFTVTQ